jgi:multiple sugar transport system substrate-binding protein
LLTLSCADLLDAISAPARILVRNPSPRTPDNAGGDMKRNASRLANAMDRRDFLRLTGAGLAGAALLPACGGFSGESEGSGSSKLILSHGPDPVLEKLIPKQLEDFNKQHKGEIEATFRPMGADYFDQLRTQFQAGGGDIDVISGDVIWPAQFGANGWIDDLSDLFTEEMQSGFLEGPLAANVYQGAVYGVPWFTDLGMLYYRIDLLKKNGFSSPPKTYDELFSMAKEIQAADGVRNGHVFQGAAYESGTCNGLEYIWAHGGDALDPSDPTKVVIDSPEAAKGLTTERATVEEGITPEAIVTFTEPESESAYVNGDSVFMRNWPYVFGLVLAGDAKVKLNQMGVAPLPAGEGGSQGFSCLGGWNLFVNAASDKKDEAWELIKFLSSPEAAKFRAVEGSYLSALQETYNDQEVTSKVPVYPVAKQLTDRIKSRPVSEFYGDMSLEMQEQFNNSLKGETSPEDTAATLQESMQSIIDRGTS